MSAAHAITPKTITIHGALREFQPLVLVAVLRRHGIRHADLARAVKKRDGTPWSRSGLSFLMNYGEWPTFAAPAAIRQQIEKVLRDAGVSEDEIANAWLVDETALVERNALHSRPSGRHGVRAEAPVKLDLPEKEMLSSSARAHFKLFRDPFIDEIREREDIFLASDQRYIREAMYQTAKNGGFIAVVGESGAGKTTLRHDLIARVKDEALQTLFIQPRVIDKQKLTARSVCAAILADLAPSVPHPNSLEMLARKVEKVLTESHALGNRHTLIIEESQDLTVSALKHLKRFYELQVGFTKLLAIILVGQPELENLLDERQHFELREVIRRCQVAKLAPLDSNVKGYLEHKFKRQNVDFGKVFAPDAFDAIVQRLTRDSARGKTSMVYPLVVNNVVTKAMNLAASVGAERVTAEVIKEV